MSTVFELTVEELDLHVWEMLASIVSILGDNGVNVNGIVLKEDN